MVVSKLVKPLLDVATREELGDVEDRNDHLSTWNREGDAKKQYTFTLNPDVKLKMLEDEHLNEELLLKMLKP